MDREQHTVQDSAEAYAVYVMQSIAEQLGIASSSEADGLWAEYLEYLASAGLSLPDMTEGKHSGYVKNVDQQVPDFIERLRNKFPHSRFNFVNVEREARNRGAKADVHILLDDGSEPIALSLKNYTGKSGIKRPQVMSGTFLSFAQDFLFTRVGPGLYLDPGDPTGLTSFSSRDASSRDAAIKAGYENAPEILSLIAELELVNAKMRADLLGKESRFYNKVRFAAAKKQAVESAIPITVELLASLPSERVKQVFLTRIGMSGAEEVLFFDSVRYLDSLTDPRFHELRAKLTAKDSVLSHAVNKSTLCFTFSAPSGEVLLGVDVPFTINTNGAWHRPKIKYSGKRTIMDKGHLVELEYGELRPYKSLELATSVNTYVDFSNAGVF